MLVKRISGVLLAVLLSSSLFAATSEMPAPFYNVKDHGAAGDGQTKDTRALQGAIDAANQAGGGTVLLPPGKYLSGTIVLKDFVTLHLEAGATLLGSKDIKDYPTCIPRYRSYTDNYTSHALIYAEGRQHVAITGRGLIDGQGAAFPWAAYHNRPYVIRFVECRDVLIEGIRLQNSPMWMQQYLACDNLTVRGIQVYNHAAHNNDMIDIDCCRDVIVSDCIGDSDDDALTLKSTADRPCENVVITNCILSSHCNALKMGTESNGGFKDVAISNCVIRRSQCPTAINGSPEGHGGIALMIVDGGVMERVTISNVTIQSVRSPIFLRLGDRARPFREGMAKPGVGAVRDVKISHVIATGVGNAGCSITGLPGHPIRNVSLSDVRIVASGGGTRKEAERPVDEKAGAYPNPTMWGVLPAYGFYCRHVEGLTLNDIEVGWAKTDQRPALVCDDVRNLALSGFRNQNMSGSLPTVLLKDVVGAMLRGCSAPADSRVFLRLAGKTDRIGVGDNDFRAAKQALEFAEGTPETAIFSLEAK